MGSADMANPFRVVGSKPTLSSLRPLSNSHHGILLDNVQRQALAGIVESGPIPAIHGVVRWRLIDLTRWLYDEFGISLTETTVGRELKKLDMSTRRSVRAFFPDHIQSTS
jgi:hypothetical protein